MAQSKLNLINSKIDMLTVLELTVESPSRKRAYLCKCDCGNTCIRLQSTLRNKDNRHNCGCFQKSFLQPGNKELCTKAGLHRKNSFVNGSNIQMTLREGTIITNTSGVQGVSWSNSANKWHVYIGYQNYRANLGTYDDLEIATKVRKSAEEAIKNNNFEEFFFAIRGYNLGERNTKQFKKKVKNDGRN